MLSVNLASGMKPGCSINGRYRLPHAALAPPQCLNLDRPAPPFFFPFFFLFHLHFYNIADLRKFTLLSTASVNISDEVVFASRVEQFTRRWAPGFERSS